VHEPRRARQPARLRQRAPADGLRSQQSGACGRSAVRHAGGAAALSGRPHRAAEPGGHRRGARAAGGGQVRRAAHGRDPLRDVPEERGAMSDPGLRCLDERRRDDVRAASLHGLDFVELSDDQRTLHVWFLGKAPAAIRKENALIQGGRRVRDIRVIDLRVNRRADPGLDDSLEVTVDRPGDFSTYTLTLVRLDEHGRPTDEPMDGFDPRYDAVTFTFKAGCPSDLDCKAEPVCPPPERVEPEINYLAKDYASFRQLILDRLALIMPDWQERHVPDLGITLVELLAYVGD